MRGAHFCSFLLPLGVEFRWGLWKSAYASFSRKGGCEGRWIGGEKVRWPFALKHDSPIVIPRLASVWRVLEHGVG